MNAMPDRAAFALRKAGPPTPLLGFLAGEHADAVARVWPAPHEGFFVLPAARRHVAAVLLAGLGREAALNGTALARAVAREKDGALARRVAGEFAPGFMKSLAKAGETLWTRDAYARLMELFAEPNANRAIRHLAAVRPETLEPLGALPPALRLAKVLAATPGLQAARDLATAFALVGRMNGERGMRKAVEAWGRAKDRGALFAMAQEALTPDVFAAPAPAPDLPAPFERVATMEALARTALEFRNCLRDFAVDVANGRMAVFAWRGAPPAAVALTWDAAGWRLAEAEAADNDPLDEAPLREVVASVEAAGVRIGPSVRALGDRLRRHVYDVVEPVGSDLADRLELGDLWA